jgi:SAM-dependent methyltransferase
VQISVDRCPVCGAEADALPPVHSQFSQIAFDLRQCPGCGLSFVANPRVDFARLYDGEYYAGRGADRLVDYIDEIQNPNTVRVYEWRGIVRAVRSIAGSGDIRWLDYGCGLGGLVRFVSRTGGADISGFDEGWAAQWMVDQGIQGLTRDELEHHLGTFDVITAIEVIEHVSDPVAVMSHIASLLKPGGLCFLTTGNAEPHRKRLAEWSYVNPDIHVGYFEPRTLAALYRRAGLEPYSGGFLPGFEDIIRYKVLKNLRVSSTNVIERLVPWQLVSRIVDRRHKVTCQPLARRPMD